MGTFDSGLFLLTFYIVMILFNTYQCYKTQKKILLSLIASIILVTGTFIGIFIWVSIFMVIVKNPLGLSYWALIPINILISLVFVLVVVFAMQPFWNIYDNFKDSGKFSFKKNNPKP